MSVETTSPEPKPPLVTPKTVARALTIATVLSLLMGVAVVRVLGRLSGGPELVTEPPRAEREPETTPIERPTRLQRPPKESSAAYHSPRLDREPIRTATRPLPTPLR